MVDGCDTYSLTGPLGVGIPSGPVAQREQEGPLEEIVEPPVAMVGRVIS